MELKSKAAVVEYFRSVAGDLTDYTDKQLDESRLRLRVRNLTLGVILSAQIDADSFWPILETSDTDEQSETGAGYRITPQLARVPHDDASAVASRIREILGPLD